MSEDTPSVVVTAVQRADALAALRTGPLTRDELQAELDVSRTTSHRIVHKLTDESLARRVGSDYELTPLGHVVAREVEEFRGAVGTAVRLEPVLSALDDANFDVELFADANVTGQEPGDPYAPVRRFISLLRDADTLRGFDTTTVAPMYVDDVRENIVTGMQTEVIYLPEVVDQILTDHRGETAEAIESGRLNLLVHDDLPFGLVMFDDRVGVGGYGEDGMLTVFVDTDDSAVREWAESLYEDYYAEATPLTDYADATNLDEPH